MHFLARLTGNFYIKDDYEKGEIGKVQDRIYGLSFEADSLEGLQTQISEHFDEDVFVDTERNMLVLNRHENRHGLQPNKSQLKRWRDGKYELFSVRTEFYVYQLEHVKADQILKDTSIKEVD